ncbi:MAG TPA: hypothetical protein RMH99_25600 [Sandaracinaceae bacterium LLY-WYZ-13_1]|nr:hypothetical protein [Sandaracinaceae bacterium LLY-WYZ-13_1]
MRISNSFSEGEIQVLDFILSTLLRGGSPAMATRNKDFASLCRKVVSMKTRVEQKKRKDAMSSRDDERPAPEQSSVGEIEAADGDDDSLEDVG